MGCSSSASLPVATATEYFDDGIQLRWRPGDELLRPDNIGAQRSVHLPLLHNRRLVVGYAAVSERGLSSPQKANQDSFVALERFGARDDVALFGVFDGHGPCGEVASHFCRENVPELCANNRAFTEAPLEALQAALRATHRGFLARSADFDTSMSGTTACMMMLVGSKLFCANVGDSRCVLVSVDSEQPVAQPLSFDHNPSRADERARVSAPGKGVLLSEAQLGGGGSPDKIYVCRKARGVIMYGVLFTRSIGDADAHTHLGLSAIPDVVEHELVEHADRFVVLASDGVFDVLTNAEVGRLAHGAGGDAHAAAIAIVQAAKARWGEESPLHRDDITALVLTLRVVEAAEVAALAPQEALRDPVRGVSPPDDAALSEDSAPPLPVPDAAAGIGSSRSSEGSTPPPLPSSSRVDEHGKDETELRAAAQEAV